ncbi:MAG: response regulator [Gammaproteobacteria bacterium]|nr:response regulator [Gammaproteobacteria bacterium]
MSNEQDLGQPPSNINILVVDDDPLILELLCTHLELAGFSPVAAADGLQAMEFLSGDKTIFTAIISDVEMPGMDGYALCEKIREDERLQSLPFIFVSSHIDIDEKLKGYSVGADEYITKPIEVEEVILKLRNIIDNRINHESLSKQLAESYRAAMNAMTYSGRLGQVLQFINSVNNVESFEELAQKLFETLDVFGLNSVIQLHTRKSLLGFSRKGGVTPLESNVLELTRDKGRFFDFGARTIVNYKDFSLLVKNMPVDNADNYGAIKDVLGNLGDAIEVVVKMLLSNEITQEKSYTISSADSALNEMKLSLQVIQTNNERAIENMIGSMEDAMITLGLTDAQEETLRSITFQYLHDSTRAFEEVNELYNSFVAVQKTLSSS